MGIYTQSREISGVILGGGRGTRLHPLTENTSKQLLPIGGKPMVMRVVEQLLAADVKDIVVLIDDRHASQYMEALKDGSELGANSISYAWQPREGKGLPTAINQVRRQARYGKFVVACGDVLIEQGIQEPVNDFMMQQIGARLTTVCVEDSAGYSPLTTEGDNITDIKIKDSNRHEPGMIDLGVYMYEPEVFNRIESLTPSERGETEIWDLNMQYAAEGKLRYTAVDGWWSDTGSNLQAYYEADRHYAKI